MLLSLVFVTQGLCTEAPTLIQVDAVWDAASSPWEVAEGLTIQAGATLEIEPGTTVELAEGASIRVEGGLRAIGTDEAPIVFTRPGDAEGEGWWGSILFAPGSEDARYEDVDSLVGGSALVGCELRWGSQALRLEGASPLVRDCRFEHNAVEPEGSDSEGGAAIYVTEGSRARIEGNHFEDNHVGGWGYGGAVEVYDAAPILHGNRFVGNSSVYGGALCLEISPGPVVGNHFEGNTVEGEGGAVSLYSSAGPFLDNTVVGNESLFDGGGVHVCVDCKPHAAPWMADNLIRDNTSRAIGAGGVGAAWLRGFVNNDVYGNLRADEASELVWTNEAMDDYPAWVHSPAIPGNWWGSSDPEVVEEGIHDGEDEDGYGVVDWQPAAEGPVATPTPRALITTLQLRYDQPGQPMPADLTVYNPGQARAVLLRLFLRVGPDLTLPYRRDLGLPQAEPTGDGWRIELPADAAIFTTIDEPARPDEPQPPEFAWIVTLHDVTTGALIGDAMTTPVLLDDGGAR